MTATEPDWRARLTADGFVLLRGVLAAAEVRAVIADWDTIRQRNAADGELLGNGPPVGARNLLRMWPAVIELARRPRLLTPLVTLLGSEAGVVRGLYFDKPPGRSWALPWHKDYTIAVAEHRSCGVFQKPTRKAGVPHVEAPAELLDRMVTARVHLDDMTDENGPLRVIPGSHRGEDREPVTVHCRAGDVLLMRPLLTHASGHCSPTTTRHRRIVHLECAALPELPDGYEWHDYIRLASEPA